MVTGLAWPVGLRGLLLLSVCWTQTLAAAGLSLSVDKRQATLGEPIQVRIAADAALNDLDLSAWQRDFEIFSRAASLSGSDAQIRGTLELTLYPLRSGSLPLPALRLGARHSPRLTLEIAPSPLHFSTRLEPISPSERQAATLTLQFNDPGDLSFGSLPLDASHITWRALPESMSNEAGLRTLRWTILPLQSGGLRIAFPMLDAYRFGQRLRYPLPPVHFRAGSLPAYLPLYVPVGKPSVSVDALPSALQAGRPFNWKIEIDAPGLSPAGALKLLQSPSAPGLRFYTPRATTIKRDGRELIQINFSFEAGGRGVREFPALHFPYFDPATQTLHTLSFPARMLQVRDPAWIKQIISVLLAVALLALVALGNKLAPRLRAWRQRRRWLGAIQHSTDVRQLYRLLTLDAPWPSLSLKRWPVPLRAHVQPDEILAIETQRFGAQRADVDADAAFSQTRRKWQKLAADLPLEFFKV